MAGRPASNHHVHVIGDVTYKELGTFLRAQQREIWNEYYGEEAKPKSSGWLRLRFAVLKRDNYHCRLCGRGVEDGVKLEAGHIVARAKDGKDEMDNLLTMCSDCNRGMLTDEP